MGMSVRDAQARVDSAEFAEWIAFNNLEAFTVDRSEYMLAVVACILANTNRKPNSRAFEPKDFLPEFKRKEPQTSQSVEQTLRALLNGNN